MTKGVFEVTGIHHSTIEKKNFGVCRLLQRVARGFPPHQTRVKAAYGKEIGQNPLYGIYRKSAEMA